MNSTRCRAVAVAIALATLTSCATEAPPAEAPLRPVRSEIVRPASHARERTFTGAARAGTESNLSFRVGGTVERLPARVGLEVARGALLAQLDTESRSLQVQEARAGLAQAEAASRNAVSEYERVRALYENRNASKSQLDAARAQYESTQAMVAASASRVELARTQLADTGLRAPFAGTVSAVAVEINENVQPGQAIVVLSSENDAEVEFGVPEVVIADVRPGDAARVRFPALPDRIFAATVTEVGVSTGRATSTYPVRARLDDAGAGVRSGMAAEATLALSEGGAARILVPAVAVGEDRDGRFVFIVEPGGDGTATVRRRAVEVGELGADGLEITGGVEAGERIATAGVRRLSDGLRVRLLEDGS